MTDLPDTTRSTKRRRAIALGALVGVVAGLAAVYGIGAMQRNPTDPACRAAAELSSRLAPLARGEVAAITIASSPGRLPDLAFQDASGKPVTLADFRGRTVLLNLWATWCVPCRKEMPALDALQGKLGGATFQVVAVNIDTRNLDKPKAWLSDVGIKQLSYYADPSAKVFQDLKATGKAVGMPTTLLVDPNGCELGVLAGPAEWASDDAVKLIETATGRAS
ncbi:MAG: TlpA family protein disulfide reductase [Alphaproteobacteria bacterium]|nr:MAG: TlpA family protein disulfide reductase [Alphaproteobacteria bacterium]